MLNSWHKLLLLLSLYLSQGLPYGFFTQALPVLLRKQNISLEAIGLSSLLALPWALKFLWAPYVDRYSYRKLGHRRSWIVPLQIAAIIIVLIIGLKGRENQGINILLVGVFLTNLIAATQDIATDGLAVELLQSNERGFANGLQVAGYRLGMIIGGGVLLILHTYLGWSGIFYSMAAILLLATLPILLFKDPTKAQSKYEKNIPGYFLSAIHPKQLPLLL